MKAIDRKTFIGTALLGIFMLLALMATSAHAGVTGTTGAISYEGPMTLGLNLTTGVTESDDFIFVWDEQQNMTLGVDLSVDITDPGTYTRSDIPTPGIIPSGTPVSSYILHFDEDGGQELILSGSITFDTAILGLIMETNTPDTLVASDDVVGIGTTTYDPGGTTSPHNVRGLETFDDTFSTQDGFTLSADRLTVSVNLKTRNGIDEMRIITLTPECVQPPSGMVSWWPGDGNANDIEGTNDGALVGDTTFVAGKVDQAFSFDGVGDFVEVRDDPSLNPGTSSFTVDFWVRTSVVGFQVFFSKGGTKVGSGGLIRFDTGQGGSDRIRYILGDGDGHNIATTGFLSVTISDGQFHHIAIAVDGPNQLSTLYVDGVKDFTRSIEGLGSIDPVGRLLLGGGLGTGDMVGELDEIEFFDRELSEAEIQAIYNADSGGKCKEEPCFRTIGYWKNHSWEGAVVTINSELIDENDGIPILSAAKSKNFSMLFAQLIAAKLNCSVNACTTTILDLITEAEDFLGNAGISAISFEEEFANKTEKRGAVPLSEALDEFNNSIPCVDDE